MRKWSITWELTQCTIIMGRKMSNEENKFDRILTDEEQNYCLSCNYLSYDYGEVEPDNPHFVKSEGLPDGQAQVVCPNCMSIAYVIASDEEIEKYG